VHLARAKVPTGQLHLHVTCCRSFVHAPRWLVVQRSAALESPTGSGDCTVRQLTTAVTHTMQAARRRTRSVHAESAVAELVPLHSEPGPVHI
jgi:hypothetical protein